MQTNADDPVGAFKERFRARMRGIPKYKILNGKIAFRMIRESHGEAATLIECDDFMLAFTNDGVGTKVLIARDMGVAFPKKKRFFFGSLGWDLIAANVNDLAAMGAQPLCMHDEIAVGSKEFFVDSSAVEGILDGLEEGCRNQEFFIAGGETAVLRDLLVPSATSLTGSAIGIVKPKSKAILHSRLREGDAIIGFPSSGLQTNGFTMARDIASRLPQGYHEILPSGTLLGEALLARSRMYTSVVRVLQDGHIDIHYASHISGGGWKKIMRAPQEYTYEITFIPEPPEIFRFLQERGNVDDGTAYTTWNMGIGFVIFVAQKEVESVKSVCRRMNNMVVYKLGQVRKGARQVLFAKQGLIL